jgi:hypothetical protein
VRLASGKQAPKACYPVLQSPKRSLKVAMPRLCPILCPVAAWMRCVAGWDEALNPAFLLANTNVSKPR